MRILWWTMYVIFVFSFCEVVLYIEQGDGIKVMSFLTLSMLSFLFCWFRETEDKENK